jgi:hypothetical protein
VAVAVYGDPGSVEGQRPNRQHLSVITARAEGASDEKERYGPSEPSSLAHC